ncbi:tRNA pseudouridine(55) synthase TruB [Rickettsiales bacterium]|nr:tRNA pseudouridine(55) synthase TruB [Rickettsiales bacterium]
MNNNQKNNINGWLILDKPAGISSAHAVGRIKRLLNVKKVGHAGTLDPLASGVLPLAIGEATKTAQYAMSSTKSYKFTVKWGQRTSTDDLEGEVIATSDKMPSLCQIKEEIPNYIGQIMQTPPIYSAIKVKGQRAYKLARQGEEISLNPRPVDIYKFELLNSDEESATFYIECGKGTYIRSIARDFAQSLGTQGHVTMLRRTKVGKFCEENTILLENIEKTMYKPESPGFILPVEAVLDDIPVLTFTPEEAMRISNGMSVMVNQNFDSKKTVIARTEEKLIALCETSGGNIKPVRVFNL